MPEFKEAKKDFSDFSDSPVVHVSRSVLSNKYENRSGFISMAQFKFVVISEVEDIIMNDLVFYDDPVFGFSRCMLLLKERVMKYCVSIEGHGLDILKDTAHSRLAVEDKKNESKDVEGMEEK